MLTVGVIQRLVYLNYTHLFNLVSSCSYISSCFHDYSCSYSLHGAKPKFKSSISTVDVTYSSYSDEENSGAMFVVLFLKIWAQFVEILDLNVGFNTGKMFSNWAAGKHLKMQNVDL